MQKVPVDTLKVGVIYRIHNNEHPDRTEDTKGRFVRKVNFGDGDIRYHFDHLVLPVWPPEPLTEGVYRHYRPPTALLRSINPNTHTMYVSSENMALKRLIALKTGVLVHNPLLTQYV
jgi:hypothetical protein